MSDLTAGRPTRRRHEDGAAAAIIVLFTIALVSVAGLVIDGGYALAAQRRALGIAEQASRAGADQLADAALRNGEVQVDAVRAHAAARAYLANVGATGTVAVDGAEVRVTVTVRQETTLLSAVGVDALTVSATAWATSIDEDSRP